MYALGLFSYYSFVQEKGFFELESWRAVVSTQLDLLVSQNSMLRFVVTFLAY